MDIKTIDTEYQKRIDAMTIAERGPLSEERLEWEVALRQYGADPVTRSLIEEMRARVSD